MNKFYAGLLALVTLLLGIYVALTIAPPSSQSPSYISLYPQPRALPDFYLVDNKNAAFTRQKLLDHWSLVFVGYTYCPDVCPTTLAELKRIYPQLKKLGTQSPLQVVFISVDPQRDTPQRLDEYVHFFDPEFIGASGEHKQLYPLVRAMGMMYSMVDSTDNPNYLIDHSASIVVVNPQAQVIGRFKPKLIADGTGLSDSQLILADMTLIMAK